MLPKYDKHTNIIVNINWNKGQAFADWNIKGLCSKQICTETIVGILFHQPSNLVNMFV